MTASDVSGRGTYDWGTICNTRDLGGYVPFVAGGCHLGWINRARLDLVRSERVFAGLHKFISLKPTGCPR